MARAHRPRVHGRGDEEGRIPGRVLQAGGRRADLPHPPVAFEFDPFRPPGSGLAGFPASVPDFLLESAAVPSTSPPTHGTTWPLEAPLCVAPALMASDDAVAAGSGCPAGTTARWRVLPLPARSELGPVNSFHPARHFSQKNVAAGGLPATAIW